MKSKLPSVHHKRGQNTAEYMLLLLLIGGGSIVAFKFFGKGIINRFANVVAIMTGQGPVATSDLNATQTAGTAVDFRTFETSGASSGGQGGGTGGGNGP